MVSLEDAIKTIKKEMPEHKILLIRENSTFYFFGLQPKRLWGTDEIPNGGSSYVIWKESGKFDLINFDLWDEEKFNKLIIEDKITDIDLTKIEV